MWGIWSDASLGGRGRGGPGKYGAGLRLMLLGSLGVDDSLEGLVDSVVIRSSVKGAGCLFVCLSVRPCGLSRAWDEAKLALG